MIQIDFYDGDGLRDLLPAKTLMPDKIIYFLEQKYEDSKITTYLRDSIRHLSVKMAIEFQYYGNISISEICKQLIEVIKPIKDEIYIDITGGNDIAVVCGGYIATLFSNVHLIYADMLRNCLVEDGKIIKAQSLAKLSFADYLNKIGAVNLQKDVVRFDEKTLIPLIKSYIAHYEFYAGFVTDLKKYDAKKAFSLHPLVYDKLRQADLAKDYHFINNGQQLFVDNNDILKYYLYNRFVDICDEAVIHLAIDYDKYDGYDFATNKIDMAFIYRNCPYFVSFLTKKLSSYEIYKIGHIANRISGKYGRAIAVINDLEHLNKDKVKAIEKKCRDMNVMLIVVSEILEIEELFGF